MECDTLCDQISIMVKSEVVCSGSPGMLKEKYGKGYRINLKAGTDSSLEDIRLYMQANIPEAKFIETKQNWIRYNIQAKISYLLGLLGVAKSLKIVDGFTIDVTSLEDIFLQITNAAQNDEHLKESKLLNMEENLSGYNATIENEEGSLDNIPKAAEYQPPALQE